MFLKRYTSLLVFTSLFVQSISPAFSVGTRLDERVENIVSKKYKVKNVSDMERVGVVIQPGDWLVLDIDDTILKRGKNSRDGVLNLDPQLVEMVKNWQALNAAEPQPEKHIGLLFLTARTPAYEQETRRQLKSLGFPETIEIIFAPNDKTGYQQRPTKGRYLLDRLQKEAIKPRRIIMVDDLDINLIDVEEALQQNPEYSHIPLKLVKRKTNVKIYESPDEKVRFPKNLHNLTYIKHLSGGSGGVHIVKDQEGQMFTFKSVAQSAHMKEEILADALYRSLGVPVPAFAIYDHMPNLNPIQEACQGPGPYRLAQFIESAPDAPRDVLAKTMKENFVADALLSNFDIVIGGFKNVTLDKAGTLWRLDNGGSLRYRALGESKFDLENWDPHEVREVESMRQKDDGAFVYGSLTHEDLKSQTEEILGKSPELFRTLDEISTKLHIDNPYEIREMLRLRLDDLVKKYLLPSPADEKSSNQIFDGFVAPNFGAGIFVYSIDPETNQKVILLGKRNGHNWWCNFGGKSDFKIGEGSDTTLADTAAREVQEESLGYLSFTAQELKSRPSHAILNSQGVFYRMFMAPHPYVPLERIRFASHNVDYGWTHEYSDYRWFPLDELLAGIKAQQVIKAGDQQTLHIGNMIIYPPFWEMLQETPVQGTLNDIYMGRKHRATHTHNPHVKSFSLPWFVEREKDMLAETVVKKASVLGQIKAGRPKSPEDDIEHLEEIQTMAGFLPDDAAQEARRTLREAPLSQTQAYLHQTMGSSVYASLNGDSQNEVDTFLKEHSRFMAVLNPYSIKLGHSNLPSDNRVLEVFLENDELYLQVKDKEKFKVEIQQNNNSSGLKPNDYEQLKEAVLNKAYLSFNLKDVIVPYAIKVGYAPVIIDPRFKQVLTQVLDTEKENADKVAFYHATDPLTCFLWDIFSAFRSRLKSLKDSQLTVLRGLESCFSSILDVEAFIQTYARNGKGISNYDTVDNVHYADMGLSVNPFLFGSDGRSGSCSYNLFHNVSSIAPTQQEALFNTFMATLGIPGRFQDYKALFQQYYRYNDKENSKLFQIFVDPQVVDAVAYMAITGGSIFNLPHQTYHGFVTTMAGLRHNLQVHEPGRNEDTQDGFTKSSLNSLQGRLYLNPKVFLNPRYVNIESYWRHPLSEESETSYYQKLNTQVTQDLTGWLSHHSYSPPDAFVEGTPSLKRSYRYVYEGELGLPYIEKEVKSLLPLAIRQGNIKLVKEIFQKYPELDINEPIPSLDYRSADQRKKGPLEFLTAETPNFSELVTFFLEKGLRLTNPERISQNVVLKLINELFPLRGSLTPELANWCDSTLTQLRITSISVIEVYKLGCLNLFPLWLDEVADCRSSLVDEDFPILVRALKNASTLKTLLASKTSALRFFNFLKNEADDWFRQTPWFKNLYEELFIRNPAEVIQNALNSMECDFVTQFIESFPLETLDLTSLRFPMGSWSSAGDLSKNAVIEGLKRNSSLKKVRLSEEMWPHVMVDLTSSDSGNFLVAPWYSKGKRKMLENPEPILNYAAMRRNSEAFLKIFQELPGEVPLRNYPFHTCEWVIEGLSNNQDLYQLDFSKSLLSRKDKIKLGEALKINTKLKSLKLNDVHFSEEEIKAIAEGLKQNTTLEKLFLNPDYMIQIMGHLMKAPEALFRQAPWFPQAWEEIRETPEQSIQLADLYSAHELIEKIIEETHVSALDLTGFQSHIKSKSVHFALKAMTRQTTVQKVKISAREIEDIDHMKELAHMLAENKTLQVFEFIRADNLPQVYRDLLIDGLKASSSLKELSLSEDFKLHVLDKFSPTQDQLSPGLKGWYDREVSDLLSNFKYRDWLFCLRNSLNNIIDLILDQQRDLKLSHLTESELTPLIDRLKRNQTIMKIDLEIISFAYSNPVCPLATFLEETPSIQTVVLRQETINKKEAEALGAALVKNPGFRSLDLSQKTSKKRLERAVISSLANAIVKTQFSKTVKVSPEDEINLLNELITYKDQMTPEWRSWCDTLREKLLEDPHSSLVMAIKSGHKNLAFSILETNQVKELSIDYDSPSGPTLIDMMKRDTTLSTYNIRDDANHTLLTGLLPFEDQLPRSAKAWMDKNWAHVLENTSTVITEGLARENHNLVAGILNKENVTSLTLEQYGNYSFRTLSKVLIDHNSPLESLTFAGDIEMNDFILFMNSLRDNKNHTLQSINLTRASFYTWFSDEKIDEKAEDEILGSCHDLLRKKPGMTIAFPIF